MDGHIDLICVPQPVSAAWPQTAHIGGDARCWYKRG
jgi:hypothetical protein